MIDGAGMLCRRGAVGKELGGTSGAAHSIEATLTSETT